MAEDRYYLTTDKHPRIPGKLIAIITRGHNQRGDAKVVVCSVEVVNNIKEAREWYKTEMELMPWLTPEELALEAAKRTFH